MPKAVMVVYTNPVPDQEDEYNDWYDNRHLAEVCAVPGIVSARRFKIGEGDGLPSSAGESKYLALYELDADDLSQPMKEIAARSGTDKMYISPAMSVDDPEIAPRLAIFEQISSHG
jgi:hypothetical protein